MPLFQSLGETLHIFSSGKPKPKKSPKVASKASHSSDTNNVHSSLAARLQTQRMSPSARTKEWLANNSPEKKVVKFKNSGTPSVLGVKGGGISKHSKTPQSTRVSKKYYSAVNYEGSSTSPTGTNPEVKRKPSIWGLLGFRSKTEHKGTPQNGLQTHPGEYDIEGSTVVDEIIEDDVGTLDLDGPSNLEGNTLILQDHTGDLKVHNEDGEVKEDDEEDFSDFSDEEYFLFHKLNNRGLEPIIHIGWAMDFPTLPEILFTHDREETYVRHLYAPEYHAQKALSNLIDIGMRARDASIEGIAPEKIIRRHLNDYFVWTMRDGNLKNTPHIPVLTIAVAHPGEPVQSVVNRCTDRLHDMGRRYREAWRLDGDTVDDLGLSMPSYKHRLPTIFGIIVKATGVGFITYDAAVPGKAVKNMGVWDLTKDGQDVWHAFAIAIYMICARNYLLNLKQEALLEEEIEEESDDPDA